MIGTAALVSEGVYWLGRFSTDRLGNPAGFLSGLARRLRAAERAHRRHRQRARVALFLCRAPVAAFHRARVARARISALQARIRPHFLFNSMNTIAALTRTDPARAEEAVEDLADLFRASLSDARAQITLREELEIARTYQRIEQLRLGERLHVRWDVAALPPRAVVPSLLLQPVLENAIGHGIEPLPQGGTVEVRGWLDGAAITIEVTNPTVAMSQRRASPNGNRMALDNIRQRLELAFPGRSGVEVDDQDQRYRVRLRFPRVGDEGAHRSGRRVPSRQCRADVVTAGPVHRTIGAAHG